LRNYDALDPAAANRSSSAFVLESICFIFLPGIDHVIGVYGTSPNSHSSEGRDNDIHSVGSRVASIDSFFCLVAMYDCGGFPVRMERARSFVGRFPISVSCLKKVVQDGRCQRVLNLQNLGLSTDQWDCILRSCGSPNVQLGFSGPDFAQNPEAICALIQGLRGSHCCARINVGDVQSLPRNVFEDFANAVQQNISITELELTVDGTRSSFHAAEIDSASEVVLIRFFDCLS
jgi:hypothetical protein